jgi:hypothetical protein
MVATSLIRGRPLLVANRYQPQQYLIGPVLFPIYRSLRAEDRGAVLSAAVGNRVALPVVIQPSLSCRARPLRHPGAVIASVNVYRVYRIIRVTNNDRRLPPGVPVTVV